MRIAIRLVGILAVLVVTLLIALAVALPRLVRSDAARTRIEQAARDATGREIRYGELDFALLPPRLVIAEPAVLGEGSASPPVFEARAVELEIALAPLLAWTVVVDSLVVEGASVRLVRTREGIELPLVAAEKRTKGAQAEAAAKRDRESKRDQQGAPSASQDSDSKGDEDAGGVTLAVRQISLRDCRLLLEDRTLSKPVTWELRDVNAEAFGQSMDEPIDFEFRGTLASGGSFRAKGEAQIKGAFRVDLQLRDVALAPAAPYLAKGQRVSGSVSGTVSSSGTAEQPERVELDLLLREGEVAADDLAIRGEMKVRAEVTGGLANAKGNFQLDATDAELSYGTLLQKGRGTAATASGRIVSGPNGQIGLRDTQVKLRNFEAEVQVETGARTRATIDADPFELAGWEALVPALEEVAPRGGLGLRGLSIATQPLDLRGDLDLKDVRLRRPDAEEVVLNGALRGTGGGMRSDALVARVAGQEIRLAVDVTELAGRPRFDTQVETDDAESGALLALLGDQQQKLQGPLRLRASLQGPLDADRPVAETLAGTVRFSIEPGRLKGVSLLEQTFAQVGTVSEAALLAGRLKGDRGLQRFYDDEFQYLGGSLQIARGLAKSDDLRLVYRNYSVDLSGVVNLLDQRLDLRGQLTIDDEIDTAIAGQDASEPKPRSGKSRVIPLARVTGTIDSPRVKITDEALMHFATSYATNQKREKWERQIDERLGEGTGRQALDALDEILKGKAREPRQ